MTNAALARLAALVAPEVLATVPDLDALGFTLVDWREDLPELIEQRIAALAGLDRATAREEKPNPFHLQRTVRATPGGRSSRPPGEPPSRAEKPSPFHDRATVAATGARSSAPKPTIKRARERVPYENPPDVKATITDLDKAAARAAIRGAR